MQHDITFIAICDTSRILQYACLMKDKDKGQTVNVKHHDIRNFMSTFQDKSANQAIVF